MMVIGVTGGMASGKSTLAAMFAGRGIAHLDADKIVHHLMRDDADTIDALGKAFPQAIDADGMVDRAALAAHISSFPRALMQLEAILHPRVRAMEMDAIAQATRHRFRALILDIPLLFETDAQTLCDKVIVAHAPLHQRRRRAFARSGMTEAKWKRLLDRQLPDHARNRAADIVIPTAIGKAATRRKVMQLMIAWGLQ